MLQHRYDLELWHDRTLTLGSEWRAGIERALEHASAAVLLISPDFFTSEFIRTTEVPLLLDAAQRRGLKLIPIIVEECAWDEAEWLEGLQVCLAHDRPFAVAAQAEIDEAWKRVVSELRACLEDRADDLPASAGHRTNLSAPLTSFIGRDRERRELQTLLRPGGERLVTLTGGPGLGKTRLARQLGWELLDLYPGGCWFANLAVSVTLTGVAHAIAQAFEVSVASGQISDQDAIVELLDHRPPLLLILDNFEQIVDLADDSVGYWVERVPGVTFLVTSRELLRVEGEREYRLDALAVPPADWESSEPEQILRYDSARLFFDRARRAWPQFALDQESAAAVARICTELDGIPLALELAAAKARVLPAVEIAKLLHGKLSALRSTRRGTPDRQQTLYASIDWSFQLLKPWEQRAFLQLCVFRGGFFLEAAEATVDLSSFPDAPPVRDVVEILFDKSLINQVQTEYGRRFDMLISIDDYAKARWQSLATAEEQESLAHRWAEYYIPYVEQWNAKVHTAEGLKALDLLTLELENVFDIQDWFLEHDEPVVAAQAILAFSATMAVRGPAHLRVPRLRKSLVALGEEHAELRLQLMTALSAAHWSLGEWNEATELADQAVALAGGSRSYAAAAALRQQGRIRTDRGYLRRALISLSRAKDLYDDLEAPGASAMINGDLAGVFDRLGEFARSIELTNEAIHNARAEGDEAQLAIFRNRQGLAFWHHGHPAEALEAFEEAEWINTTLRAAAWIGAHRTNQGLALVDLDEFERALERFASAESIHRKLGTQAWAAVNLGGRGRALMMRGGPSDLESALDLFTRAGEISGKVYYPENISFHAGDKGRCLLLLGRFEEARRAVREAVALERVIGASTDLRHFGNLVTLSRIARQLGRSEECVEAMTRARELLTGGLDVARDHRVRRVREDVEALERLAQEGAASSPAERRVVTLLRKHGRRPPDQNELAEIGRAVARSFSETSYEYPWAGLEEELAAQGSAGLRLFGYGSLINRASAAKTFPRMGERFVPALAFGVLRLFNYDMPDVLRERHYPALRAGVRERGVLNAQVTGFLTDAANGVMIGVDAGDIPALREREVGYDLRPVVCIDWSGDAPVVPRLAYVLSAPNRLWKGRPLTDSSLRPLAPYLQQCVDGGESFATSFAGFWRDTTFLADGETPLPPLD